MCLYTYEGQEANWPFPEKRLGKLATNRDILWQPCLFSHFLVKFDMIEHVFIYKN